MFRRRHTMARWVAGSLALFGCGEVLGPLETWRLSQGADALGRGEAALALELFEKAGALDDDPRLHRNRALALHLLGRDPEALEHLEKALRSTEAAVRARVRADRCVILARIGRTRDAISDCRSALLIDPADDGSRKLLEVLLRLLAKARPDAQTGLAELSLDEATTVPSQGIVAIVTFDRPPTTAVRGRRWRQRIYEQFDGVQWTRSGEPPMVDRLEAASPTITQHVRTSGDSPIGLDPPLGFTRAVDGGPGEYVVESPEVAPAIERGDDLEMWRQLPDGIDSRIAALAERATGETRDPLIAAARLVEFFRLEYSYSLVAGEPSVDPLSAFLFGRKQGSCRHFATAMTVMLRRRGFSARPVGGIQRAEVDGNVCVLRASQAHAWVQVFSPEQGGWATFDPTPPSSAPSAMTPAQAATIVHGIGSKPAPFRPAPTRASVQTKDW